MLVKKMKMVFQKKVDIPYEYSNIEEYYKYVNKNGKALKVYKGENIYLLFNKETYEVEEYVYDSVFRRYGCQLYDLETEELLAYCNGIGGYAYNKEYFYYLTDNSYEVHLANISDYVDGYDEKEYYSLEEIKELEPQIIEGLKIINNVKTKVR